MLLPRGTEECGPWSKVLCTSVTERPSVWTSPSDYHVTEYAGAHYSARLIGNVPFIDVAEWSLMASLLSPMLRLICALSGPDNYGQ